MTTKRTEAEQAGSLSGEPEYQIPLVVLYEVEAFQAQILAVVSGWWGSSASVKHQDGYYIVKDTGGPGDLDIALWVIRRSGIVGFTLLNLFTLRKINFELCSLHGIAPSKLPHSKFVLVWFTSRWNTLYSDGSSYKRNEKNSFVGVYNPNTRQGVFYRLQVPS